MDDWLKDSGRLLTDLDIKEDTLTLKPGDEFYGRRFDAYIIINHLEDALQIKTVHYGQKREYIYRVEKGVTATLYNIEKLLAEFVRRMK